MWDTGFPGTAHPLPSRRGPWHQSGIQASLALRTPYLRGEAPGINVGYRVHWSRAPLNYEDGTLAPMCDTGFPGTAHPLPSRRGPWHQSGIQASLVLRTPYLRGEAPGTKVGYRLPWHCAPLNFEDRPLAPKWDTGFPGTAHDLPSRIDPWHQSGIQASLALCTPYLRGEAPGINVGYRVHWSRAPLNYEDGTLAPMCDTGFPGTAHPLPSRRGPWHQSGIQASLVLRTPYLRGEAPGTKVGYRLPWHCARLTFEDRPLAPKWDTGFPGTVHPLHSRRGPWHQSGIQASLALCTPYLRGEAPGTKVGYRLPWHCAPLTFEERPLAPKWDTGFPGTVHPLPLRRGPWHQSGIQASLALRTPYLRGEAPGINVGYRVHWSRAPLNYEDGTLAPMWDTGFPGTAHPLPSRRGPWHQSGIQASLALRTPYLRGEAPGINVGYRVHWSRAPLNYEDGTLAPMCDTGFPGTAHPLPSRRGPWHQSGIQASLVLRTPYLRGEAPGTKVGYRLPWHCARLTFEDRPLAPKWDTGFPGTVHPLHSRRGPWHQSGIQASLALCTPYLRGEAPGTKVGYRLPWHCAPLTFEERPLAPKWDTGFPGTVHPLPLRRGPWHQSGIQASLALRTPYLRGEAPGTKVGYRLPWHCAPLTFEERPLASR
ncbi:hypothetical protein NDU88_005938 [Pleurodeles waltl]|uniref:Uncharacterized protein n=1 Tax=Pleurodeles waltl TaxID=8319 RepID=A0AAV7LAS2_PLEWA|nr:hypothetical protein NDU88_005938 [Pleurodeles waltl]